MKKFIELIKKYKVYILSILLVVFFFRSCSKSGEVRKLEKNKNNNVEMIDSLNSVIKGQRDTISNISEIIRVEKIKVHTEYDNYISERDRGEQLMELHKVVKENIKKLEK
jgi:PBP1b-binding outer membrane lipoprotein LpoB